MFVKLYEGGLGSVCSGEYMLWNGTGLGGRFEKGPKEFWVER